MFNLRLSCFAHLPSFDSQLLLAGKPTELKRTDATGSMLSEATSAKGKGAPIRVIELFRGLNACMGRCKGWVQGAESVAVVSYRCCSALLL